MYKGSNPGELPMPGKLRRRNFLLTSAATLAAAGTMPNSVSAKDGGGDRGSVPKAPASAPSASAAEMPCGQFGKLKVSRLILGGNLIAGYAHSRDLIYVNQLFKSYNTEKKVYETLAKAEENGVNTIISNEDTLPLIAKYRKETGGKMQAIASVKCSTENDLARFDKAAENGAVMLYLHGHVTDLLVKHGQIEVIRKAIQHVREVLELPAGIGGHALEVPMACAEHKIDVDFHVQTFHQDCYRSAIPAENRKPFCWYEEGGPGNPYYDNMWCLDAKKTAEFMASVKKPWIAFKVLAAGAIPPAKALRHALENGADFIALGMFDWQIEEDSKVFIKAFEETQKRARPWSA
jgi:hypothetical protein